MTLIAFSLAPTGPHNDRSLIHWAQDWDAGALQQALSSKQRDQCADFCHCHERTDLGDNSSLFRLTSTPRGWEGEAKRSPGGSAPLQSPAATASPALPQRKSESWHFRGSQRCKTQPCTVQRSAMHYSDSRPASPVPTVADWLPSGEAVTAQSAVTEEGATIPAAADITPSHRCRATVPAFAGGPSSGAPHRLSSSVAKQRRGNPYSSSFCLGIFTMRYVVGVFQDKR